ncbi:protein-glucosylgalactosylhydroxylysine glucosidase-like [Anopheles bellator]|uniref:protein-glucosylgalactosylhydroxylysine glucosidase-like n=1 Tax=Anopheles bellator TaxID=139047 RepID=UPI0026482F46|nr:protein-glucosylgalactosylhydroxylysine glucosidase-like [Anopheles bellator]
MSGSAYLFVVLLLLLPTLSQLVVSRAAVRLSETVTNEAPGPDVDKLLLLHELTESRCPTDGTSPLPTLANGHLGFTVFETAVYMAGLYNGAGGLSHRARIPNVANIRVNASGCILALDMAQGLFRVEHRPPSGLYRVVQLLYPHALYRRLIVNQVTIERLRHPPDTGAGPSLIVSEEISVPLMPPVPFASEDIHFEPVRTVHFRNLRLPDESPAGILIYQSCGETIEVEDRAHQPEGSAVCVLWNHVPERLTLGPAESTVSFKFIMTVDGEVGVARNELRTALLQPDEELLRAHTSLWGSLWNRFDVLTTGNDQLQRAVRASIFYLVSNLPFGESVARARGPFAGLSPTGLGRGGADLADYEGHSFWDTEIWMFPVLNLIDRSYARWLIEYRTARLAEAKALAAGTGFPGARFPWESGFTGVEVTQPCCPEVAQYQHHITGDISFAVRQHLAVTQDLGWLQESGACRMAQEIAAFWAARLTFNYSGTGQYDIAAIMGPDEDHENVTNNAYTNVIAGYALYFGDFAGCLCNNSGSGANWSEIAKRLKLPYDSGLDYHPQYDGYQPGTVIKQADTVLLGYPLQYAGQTATTRSNDLKTYEAVTRRTGPAMTWAMHSINHLDLGELDQAATYLNRSYQPYMKGSFLVWYELQQPSDSGGAKNFVTGAGGFLQAMLFGYGGARIYLDRMEVRGNLEPPPGSSGLVIKGIQYLGALITVVRTVDQSTLTVTHIEKPLTIEFGDGNAVDDVTVNATYALRNRTAIVRSKSIPFGRCRLPEDLIGA